MTPGASKYLLGVLSASCLTAGLLTAPALGVQGHDSLPAASRAAVLADQVRPGRIEVRITMNGPLLGSKPRITLVGVDGRAKAVTRKVAVRPYSVVKGLQPGTYRVLAQKLTVRGRTVIPRVTPAQIRLTSKRGAQVLVRYRMPGFPDDHQGDEYAPVAVATDVRFTSVTTGDFHTCGVDTTGKAWCWGDDSKGALGDGKRNQQTQYSPVAVVGGHQFTMLTAGGMYTCGVDTAGKAWCWGSDGNGKLGDGDDGQPREYSPVAVAGEHVFTTLTAANMHTCGVDTAGKAWCWGWDANGAAGDGDDGQGNEYSPVAVAGGHTFTTVTAGDQHTCGIDTEGSAWCWGADYTGNLGDGDDGQGNEYSPVAVAGGHTFTSLTAGLRHTCGVDQSRKAWCWGSDWLGQDGDGGDAVTGFKAWPYEVVPVAVAGERAWTVLTAGDNHTCGVETGGTAWCWGDAGSGRLGDGVNPGIGDHRSSQFLPVTVAGAHSWIALAGGYEHTCGVDTASKAWCWGDDGSGQVGDGDEYR